MTRSEARTHAKPITLNGRPITVEQLHHAGKMLMNAATFLGDREGVGLHFEIAVGDRFLTVDYNDCVPDPPDPPGATEALTASAVDCIQARLDVITNSDGLKLGTDRAASLLLDMVLDHQRLIDMVRMMRKTFSVVMRESSHNSFCPGSGFGDHDKCDCFIGTVRAVIGGEK